MTRLDLIEQYEDETGLPATWGNGGMGGYTKEYTNWLEQMLVKNLTIPVVSVPLPSKSKCKHLNRVNRKCTRCGVIVPIIRQ